VRVEGVRVIRVQPVRVFVHVLRRLAWYITSSNLRREYSTIHDSTI
jgi:hypothetical protein